MQIWIFGGTGLIGQALYPALIRDGHSVTVLSRKAGLGSIAWDALAGAPLPDLPNPDVVISLAGEPVAQRWTAAAKQRISDSRVQGTARLVEALSRFPQPPHLLSASATGIYGDRGDEVLDEQSTAGSGFLADVCRAWEAAAQRAQVYRMPLAVVRIAVVLAGEGGALQKMLPAFRLGLGGALAGGRQWMPWIALPDIVSLFQFLIANRSTGTFNATSPQPARNIDFTNALGKVLHRPTLARVPGFALRAVFGEMSQVVTNSQRVVPRAAHGFEFRYPQIEAALHALLDAGM
jgi:uncharacterized protein (TIGR01777 family)